ncbi:hypothetical protein PV327_008112 [Microctonus hyperodae]|uniref:Uncharacterized protein n=1 Tax=Microctonus hyperodae TaxID=165561 RepID=A0AA39KGK1_MICHY|nr:hypothetical protein PV327_008112 [Microctonus hyperodae]
MTKSRLHSTQQNIQKCTRGIMNEIMNSLYFHLATVFYITLITNPILTESTPLPNVCLTPACVQVAANILTKMDSSVDPCDNFYKFACGQFLNSTIITPNSSPISQKSEVMDDMVHKFALIFESGITKNEIKPFRQAKQFYRQCMNRKNLIKHQDKIILDILNKLGGWPVIMGDDWNSTNIDWIKLPAMLSNAGYSQTSQWLLQLKIRKSKDDLTKYFIDLSPTDQLRLQQNIPFNDPENIKFYKSLVDYAVELGAEKERAKQELMESINFEIELANIASSARDEMKRNESSLDNFMTIDEMIRKWPTIDWLTYINEIFSMSPDINKAEKNETVIINYPSYMTKLATLINFTSKRVLVNYALTQVVIKSLQYIDFHEIIILDKSQSKIALDALQVCTLKTIDHLPQITSALYIQKYIKNKTKIETINMASIIKKEPINVIHQVEWLDEQTRDKAIKKIQNMKDKIGYPDIYDNLENITKTFHDFELDGRTYLHNLLSSNRFHMIQYIRSRRNTVELDNIEYWFPVQSLEAFYFYDNVFSIAPLLLQRPFIDVEQPAYMNYGGIGSIIGHEIVHAIDNEGRQFDNEGHKRNWWIKSSKENFKKKTECFISQYDNYTVEGMNMKMNGTLTLNENIADNGGFRLTYLAYKNWSSRYGPEPKLPALDYNPSQMFWITIANSWCSKQNNDDIEHQIKFDPHSLDEYRILGAFSNIPEFSDDFNCPLGSPMNPEKKCKVW